MFTEDDTFNALRRTPHAEMKNIMNEFFNKFWSNNEIRVYREARNELLRTHGWEPREYNPDFVE